MSQNIDGKVVVITGASCGIGEAIARRLAGEGEKYRPEDIDEVLITYLHTDNVGGLSAGGKRAFPNATVRLTETERAFWLDNANTAKVDDSVKSSFAVAPASPAPYIAAGRVKSFTPGAVLDPGITPVFLPDHWSRWLSRSECRQDHLDLG